MDKGKLRKKLYERDGRDCHYCGIKEGDFLRIWGVFYRTRGKRLELERTDNKKGYTLKNCVLACAICNNAKSNKFTSEEFKTIGKAIKKIWLKRISKIKGGGKN